MSIEKYKFSIFVSNVHINISFTSNTHDSKFNCTDITLFSHFAQLN